MTAPRRRRWGALRDLLGLLASWWRVDRMRLSPREGRLLRLSPGDVLRVDEVSALVIRRIVVRRGSSPAVMYRCRTEAGEATLTVSFRPDAGGVESDWVSSWNVDGRTSELHEDEVETY